MATSRIRALLLLSALAIAVGVADGLVFLGFEWLAKHGTDWIWNDLAGSDDERWRVVPLAVALSIAFSAVLLALREPRWVEPHLDPLAAAEGDDQAAPPTPTLGAIATIFAVGLTSLLAGAALGPEAPLVGLTLGLGLWVAARARLGEAAQLLALASVGALLVAFFGSLVALAAPVLVLWQRRRSVPLPAIVVIALCGLAAFGTLEVVQGDHAGFGEIPSFGVAAHDYLVALLLGAVGFAVGAAVRWCIPRLASITRAIDGASPWWLAAAAFGLVLGLLYLLGGEVVQFSGSEGSGMLLGDGVERSAWTLAGIAVVKILVTAWSMAAGYRGGLVFPSVFISVACGLCLGAAIPDAAGPGALIGAIAGLLVAMTSPALGAIILLALLPLPLLPLGLAGAAGAVLAERGADRHRAGALR